MGFGILAGSFSQGAQRGINMANSLQSKQDEKDRQVKMDQRYQDGINRQTMLDDRNESRWQDSQERIGIADERANTLFDQSQRDRKHELQVGTATTMLMRAGLSDSATVATDLMNTKKGKALMKEKGFSSVEFHQFGSNDDTGKPTGELRWYATAKNANGDNFMINGNGDQIQPDDPAAEITQQGLLGLGMHFADVTPEAATEAFNAVQKSLGTMTDKEKLYAKHKYKITEDKQLIAGRADAARITAESKKTTKSATSSEMRKLRAELGDSATLSKVLASTLSGESLPDNVIPYVNSQMERRFNEGMSSEQIRQAVLADVKQRLISEDGALYGKNFTFNDSGYNPKETDGEDAKQIDPSLITQANIEHTAKTHGMTVEQVKAKLGVK